MAADDEAVGYGRPPRAHRFKKGVSGNPKGRPRYAFSGPAEDSILSRVISRRINIAIDGRTRRVPIKEAIALQLVDKAAKGDLGAIRLVMAVGAAGEMKRDLPPEFDEDYRVLLKRLWSLSDLEESLGHAGLLFSDADHNLYFKREVFEAATAGRSSRPPGPELRLTTSQIEAGRAQADRECVFEVFSRVLEQLLHCRR
ncbi:DUF5681 domain-containing protein [Brevundimonas sp.]|uniref:DUF5681 domain-containing protein n=1 Tax=Brevundimonas sp. TaxID=1871086 RepID=UPI003F6E49E1